MLLDKKNTAYQSKRFLLQTHATTGKYDARLVSRARKKIVRIIEWVIYSRLIAAGSMRSGVKYRSNLTKDVYQRTIIFYSTI